MRHLGTAVVAALLLACGDGGDGGGGSGGSGGSGATDPIAGSWRILSETLYLDGGGGGVITPVSHRLELAGDGRWTFGTSAGTWSTRPVEAADWARWGIEAYGPTRVLSLAGWAAAGADGPIEGPDEAPEFLWVIYHVDDPEPGTVWMKLGR